MRSRRLWASTAVLGLVAALLPAGVAVAIPSCGMNCYVSPAGNDGNSGTGPSPGDALKTIQAGVNAVFPTGTVHVAAGTYVEDVTISKFNMHLLGAGIDSSIISGPIGGGGATVRVSAADVEIAGFTITREGNTLADWDSLGLNSAGIAIQSQGNYATVRRNKITHNRTGIDINNSDGNTIMANLIVENRTGLLFRNQTDHTTVIQNKITDNSTLGVLFMDASGGTNSPAQRADHGDFSNNDISDNWYGQIVDRQAGGSLPPVGTNLKDFSTNWLGTTTPVITSADSAEPGYAA